MTDRDQRLKTLQIKLFINLRNHQDIAYAPYMTLPGQTTKDIYFMPTIPMTITSISNALEVINKAAPRRDDIIKVFFSKADMLNVLNQMVKDAQKSGTPLVPLQFERKSDLIGGKVTRTPDGKFIFRKPNTLPVLLKDGDMRPSPDGASSSFDVNSVRASRFRYGSTIIVSNVDLAGPLPLPANARTLSFKNGVKANTIDDASRKNIIDNNIKLIASLLFGPDQKFYYKGLPKFGYGIYSYSVEPSRGNPGKLWDAPDPTKGVFAATVRLRLAPIKSKSDTKETQQKQSLQGCQLRKADIIRDFHILMNKAVPEHIDSLGLVDDPEEKGTSSRTRQFEVAEQRRVQTAPAAAGPVAPPARPVAGLQSTGGSRSARRRRRTATRKNRAYKESSRGMSCVNLSGATLRQ